MNCQTARRRLLTAEPEALRGRGESPLARHLRSCPDCRRAAGLIADEELELGAAVASLARRAEPETSDDTGAPSPPPEGGGEGRSTGDPESGPRADGRAPRRSPGPVPWRALVPLAAAAAAALLLLRPGDEPDPPAGSGARTSTAPAGEPPEIHVQAPASQRLLLFQPADPDITVVWFVDDREDAPIDTERN